VLFRPLVAVAFAAIALSSFIEASAETPTPTPTPAVTPTTPVEPEFNYDVVKEVVAPLIGEDGRTHYVTLTQDTNGVVRVRLSLFSFPAGNYNVIVRASAKCGDEGGLVGQLTQTPLVWTKEYATALVLQFYNTRVLSLTPGAPGSIYDADGAALAIYRPGDSGEGLRAACALLGVSPGPPGTGSGIGHPNAGGRRMVMPIAAVVTSASTGLFLVRLRRRASGRSRR
jgi:hypothetical protein